MTHNVFWFQGVPTPKPYYQVVDQTVYQKLIAFYKVQQPDILLLQEVQSAEVAATVARDLEMNFSFQVGGQLPVYGGAILWGKPICAQTVTIPEPQSFQRFCQILIVHDHFKIANVHLPSTAQLSDEEAYAKRKHEMEQLLLLEPNVDIIAGDFNEEPKDVLDMFLTHKGYIDSFEFNKGTCTISTKGEGRGDFIRIKEKYRNLVESFFIVDFRQEEWKTSIGRLLSDHMPLVFDIKMEEV